MIQNKIEELFNTIINSPEYNKYIEINNILNKNNEILTLVEEIKFLGKEATKLEVLHDDRYRDIDKTIKKKTELLNSNPSYLEYLRSMDELNDILCLSSHLIEDYINEKI